MLFIMQKNDNKKYFYFDKYGTREKRIKSISYCGFSVVFFKIYTSSTPSYDSFKIEEKSIKIMFSLNEAQSLYCSNLM